MQFKQKSKGKYESDEGYRIEGNAKDGYEAFAPDNKMIVMWSIDIPIAKESCEDHYKKSKEK